MRARRRRAAEDVLQTDVSKRVPLLLCLLQCKPYTVCFHYYYVEHYKRRARITAAIQALIFRETQGVSNRFNQGF